MSEEIQRDVMEYDVLVVGGGPAGLSAAIHLKQVAAAAGKEINVCLVEKGSEIGAHILSGAVIEPRTLTELFPDWKERGAPMGVPVTEDEIHFFTSAEKSFRVPNVFVPKTMHNEGNFVVSLANLCRWLGEQATALGVEIYPGFAAQNAIIEGDVVKGVTIGDMGVGRDGHKKPDFAPGMELRAKYTLFAEGSRGHIGKQLLARYNMCEGTDPQHYGIGIKEVWEIPAEKHKPGLVVHGAGWPLSVRGTDATGGSFLYHAEGNKVLVGLIVDLSYTNPWLSPFDEFQRLKHHPVFAKHLEGGKRVAYGARSITKGGFNSLPKKMAFPGGALIGCDLGTMNFSKIKGSHTAMKSGKIAAEVFGAAVLAGDEGGKELQEYSKAFKESWLYPELHASRNFGSLLHKFGAFVGGGINWLELNILGGKAPWTVHDIVPDYATLKLAKDSKKIEYPKPDNRLSFDKLSSVFLSSTNHEEDQPVHLTLKDPSIPIGRNLPLYAEPAQRYCPAGVYEVVGAPGQERFQINAQNCVHCKTCDIKDPSQNIVWVAPEGSGGPNYGGM